MTVVPMQRMQETWVQSLIREDPLEKEVASCSSILAWQLFFFFNLRIVNTVKNQTEQSMGKGNEAGYRILPSLLLGHPGSTKASFAGRHMLYAIT